MTYLVKKHMMAIVAVVLVIGFSAFKVNENTTKSTKGTKESIVENVKVVLVDWSFTDNNPLNVTDPTLYTKIIGTPPPCPEGRQIVCIIEAPDDGNGLPALDDHIDPNDPSSPTYAELIEEAMQDKEENVVVKDFRSL